MPYLDEEARKGAVEHKYHAEDHSLLSKYVMQHYWEALAKLLPRWLAPNVITSIGFAFALWSYHLSVVHMPFFRYGANTPGWVFAAMAFGIFMYQTMDALDGKQARQTRSGSTFGELYDHAVDAVVNVAINLTLAASIHTGLGWGSYLAVVGACLVFYFTSWAETYTYTLKLGLINGPVDGIVLGCAFCLVPAAFPGFWAARFYGQSVGWWSVVAVVFPGALFSCLGAVAEVRAVLAEKRDLLGRTGRTAALDLVPAALLVGGFTLYAFLAPELFASHHRLFIWTFGFANARIVWRVLLCYITATRFRPAASSSLIPLPFAIANAYFKFVPDLYFLVAYFVFLSGSLLHFLVSVALEMRAATGQPLLTVPPQKKSD
eukprot:m51a1_g8596 hypothetical protein (376) ;mRNA; r:139708-141583